MAAGTIERIQVQLQAVTKGFAKGIGTAQKHLKVVGKNMSDFGAVMTKPLESFKELNDESKEMTTTGGKLAKGFRTLTHGMRGFRMEALGVMFFGMMMQRMFMNLLQPVMEVFGVFDLFRLMLLVLFLPIMEMLFEPMLKMMEWFMNLPEPVKKIIGVFVILGLIFGTIMMVIGQFILGIGSTILLFTVLKPLIASVIAFVMGLSVAFWAVLAAVVVVLIAIYVSWKENFMGMKKIVANLWDGIKRIFKGIYDVIVGTIELVVSIFKGDWDGAVEAVKRIFWGFLDFIIGIFKAIVYSIASIAIGIIRIFKFIIDRVVGFFVWLYNKIVGHSIIPEMIKAIIDWFWKLPTAVFTMFKSIVSGMFDIGKNLIQKMIDGIKSLGRKVINAILSLFPSWMRKGIESAGRITINIVKSVTEKIKRVFGGGSKDDFIWRPGQAPISINPNDTLVGFKGAPPTLGGGEGGIIQENNFYGFTMDDLSRELDNRDRRLVDELRRIVKV